LQICISCENLQAGAGLKLFYWFMRLNGGKGTD
jgi:hypothetical protein